MSGTSTIDDSSDSGLVNEETATNGADPEADRVTVRMVMTGYTQVSGKKPGVVVHIVNDDGTLGPESCYSAKGFKGVSVGHVFTVEALKDDASGRIYMNTLEWKGLWPDPQQRLAWDAEARAYQTRMAASKVAAKETKRNLIRETMAPLRAAYNATNWQNKMAFEVLVLTYLRYGDAGLDSIQQAD